MRVKSDGKASRIRPLGTVNVCATFCDVASFRKPFGTDASCYLFNEVWTTTQQRGFKMKGCSCN